MKMQGYNGSQLWDTTFAVQAITATGLGTEFAECLRRAHAYVDATQARPVSCMHITSTCQGLVAECHVLCHCHHHFRLWSTFNTFARC
jgi:hypothetical protein